MVSTTPTELPTAIIIRGKRIHLWYFVTIVCAQCLAGQSISAYSASVGTERAEVTSVVDINTRAPDKLDHHCTRTLITIKAPVLDAPAEDVPVIVRTNSGEQAVAPSLRYSTACNYDQFCNSKQPDVFLLRDQPMGALECDVTFCLVQRCSHYFSLT